MIASISVFPLGKGESLGRFVAEAVKEVRASGLEHRVTDMGTVVEGDWDEVMTLIKRMRDRVRRRCGRVYIGITIDDRRGPRRRLGSKAASVEKRLRR